MFFRCKKENYPSDLQRTSVVICFYNEHFETLIRSVTSVANRTPRELLEQIILVDDNSDIEGLSDKVSDWVKKNYDNVKYLNSGVRQGLIRARMLGASYARGEVCKQMIFFIYIPRLFHCKLRNSLRTCNRKIVTKHAHCHQDYVLFIKIC